MIENMNANEVRGQMELGDFAALYAPAGNLSQGEGQGTPGYDEAGNLLPYPAGESAGTSLQVSEESEIRLNTLAAEINAITNHARVVLASAAIDIGKRLIEAKSIVPRGRWKEWLDANVDYSERKAQILMQLADEFGRKELPEGIGLSQMTALLAAPEGEREALAEKAVDEGLSVRELQEEIRKLKAETDEKQMEIEGITKDRDSMEETLKENEKSAQIAIEKAFEDARLAEAKAKAAEASADELRKLHSDAEDRAAASAQRASDAVNRANQTAKELSEARAKIAELESKINVGAPLAAPAETVERVVEVVPEAVQNELDDLRRQLAEAKAAGDHAGSPLQGEGAETAVARFRDSYKRLTDEFKTAEALIAEIVKDDAATGHMYATAMVKSCKMMIDRLGE